MLSGEAEELATAAVVHKSSAAAEAAYHIAATPFKVPCFACIRATAARWLDHRQEVCAGKFRGMIQMLKFDAADAAAGATGARVHASA